MGVHVLMCYAGLGVQSCKGHARLVGIRRWVGIMQSLGSLQEAAPLYISQPLSPLGSPRPTRASGSTSLRCFPPAHSGPDAVLGCQEPPSAISLGLLAVVQRTCSWHSLIFLGCDETLDE